MVLQVVHLTSALTNKPLGYFSADVTTSLPLTLQNLFDSWSACGVGVPRLYPYQPGGIRGRNF